MNFQDLLNTSPTTTFNFNSNHIQGILGVGILNASFYDEKTHALIEIEREMLFSRVDGKIEMVAENNQQNRALRMFSLTDRPDIETTLHQSTYDNFMKDFDCITAKVKTYADLIKMVDVSQRPKFYFGA